MFIAATVSPPPATEKILSLIVLFEIASQKKNIYSVAGGGDTIALLNRAKVIDQLNFVSTAGGAFLEYLEGKEIPGIKSLN